MANLPSPMASANAAMVNPSLARQQPGGSIFFKLPLELRTMIYRGLFAHPDPDVWWEYSPGVRGVHLAILQTCHTIYAEATPIFYNSFFFYIFASNEVFRSMWPEPDQRREGKLIAQAINYEENSIARTRLQAGILPNIHHIRKFHLHISYSHTKTPALFREYLDRAYYFLALAIEKGGRIDHLRLAVSKPERGAGQIYDGDSGHDWTNHAVECVLGRLRGINKVEIQEGTPMTMNGNGGTQTAWTRALEMKMMSKTTIQATQEQGQENIHKLLDMYWRLERSAKHITFLAPPLSEARKMAERGDLQGFLDKRAFIIRETRLLFEEVETNLDWEPHTQHGEEQETEVTDAKEETNAGEEIDSQAETDTDETTLGEEEAGETANEPLWKSTRPTYQREPL